MTSALKFWSVSFLLCLPLGLEAQTAADGWSVVAEIASGDSLWGGWDIITDLDLDNDGHKEFIYSRDPVASSALVNKSAGQSVFYYESTGDNAFELRWSFKAPIANNAGNIYTASAVGDLDGDGLPELYFCTPLDASDSPPNPKGLYVFEFDGTNFPTEPSETWGFNRQDNEPFTCSGLAFGDVDGDGENELIIQSRLDNGLPGSGAGRTMMVVNGGSVDIGLGLSPFQIEFEESATFVGGVVYDPRIVDFDGDGKNEIWVFTWDFLSLAIYEATAPNTYELQVEMDKVFEPEDFGHRRGMRFYDADGDGQLEFYTAGIQPDNGSNSFVFYIGSTSDVSTLTPADVTMLGGRNLPSDGSAVGDLDGDNLMDFLFTARNGADEGTVIYRMEYKGTGSLADSTSYDWSLFYNSDNAFSDLRNLAIADIDGDGKTEVYITRANTITPEAPVVIVLESDNPVSVEKRPGVIVRDFRLRQNYPNPFNPTTTINFDLEVGGDVRLFIYNVIGEKVATLVNEPMSSGSYTVNFDASAFASGVYYYTLEAGVFRNTRKMLLLR